MVECKQLLFYLVFIQLHVKTASPREFIDVTYQILSKNWRGAHPGHYLKVEHNRITATGLRHEQKTRFKIYVHIQQNGNTLTTFVILESASHSGKVVYRDPVTKDIAAKQLDMKKNYPKGFDTLGEVKKKNPEILFKKTQASVGSQYTRFESYQRPGVFLAFDQHGDVMHATTGHKPSYELLFTVYQTFEK